MIIGDGLGPDGVVLVFLALSEGELLQVVELLLDGNRLAVVAVPEGGVLDSDPRLQLVRWKGDGSRQVRSRDLGPSASGSPLCSRERCMVRSGVRNAGCRQFRTWRSKRG